MTSRTVTESSFHAACRAATALALLAPTAAFAHPGHGGGFLHGLLHPMLGIDHLLAATAVGIWGARLGGRAIVALPAAFVAAMLMGSAIPAAVIGMPATEVLIAASVLALGLLIAFAERASPWLGASLVAGFALFHGIAHASEAPLQQGIPAYLLGLSIATLMLHGCGIAAALALRARPLVLRRAAAPVALAGAVLLVGRLG